MSYKILIVDDEPANLRVIERLLSPHYDVFTAENGAAGLAVLTAHDIALIISDQRMPGMAGVEFLKRAAEMRSATVRMILTGYTDIDALVESINSGVVYRYLTKPWSNADLLQTVNRAIEHFEVQRHRHSLEQENNRLQMRMKAGIRGFVDLALETIDLKGANTGDHCRRTAKYATELGRALRLDEEQMETLHLASILHEVAHLRLPAHLMSRTTLLRDGEFKVLQEKFREGVKLLARVPDLEEAATVINFHHDHWDGNGSVNRMSGEQIPLLARILTIADSYDEMREPNCGPVKGLSHDAALAIIKASAGRKFDPDLVQVFCGLRFEQQAAPEIEAARVPVLA
ncbi:MAG TPA: HD domain-containing phosphohydrolase [Pyrinomonadaceae bacterium]|jgi:response regulator RpfG family c-di-GMP phosphodiesterase|nr:HD domain-containing phosphohydrolase [Pyrinomonadaceae bacterium]